MLDAVFQVVHDETLQLINKATFIGVMADETTDISNIGQMAIHLRCVCDGAIVNRFAGLYEVAERDALSIQRAMEDKFRALHIDWKKCHLSSDGASVFTGRLNGVNGVNGVSHLVPSSVKLRTSLPTCDRKILLWI